MAKIILHPKAAVEFNSSVDWYEKQKKGLGLKFITNVESVLLKIESNPSLFPILHKSFRMASLEIFPYSIFFKVKADVILVTGIFHQKRKPSIWKKR